jgi:hypothetical protein
MIKKSHEKDYALAEGEDGEMVVHKADCPEVRAQADRGEPVMTMFGCQEDTLERLPDLRRHSCLDPSQG